MQPSYYAVIPATVRYDNKLPPNAKLLYGEITALTNQDGFCWASNQYFADLYGVDKDTVSGWMSKLSKAGHIRVNWNAKTNERKIFLTDTYTTNIVEVSEINRIGVDKKSYTSTKKDRLNNTVNNTENNNIPSTEISVVAVKEKEAKKSKPEIPKTAYRERVLLSESEYQSLIKKHGEYITLACLDKLDAYKLANDKKYKSDYGAIIHWVINAVTEDHRRKYGNKPIPNQPPATIKDNAPTYQDLINPDFKPQNQPVSKTAFSFKS